MCHTRQRDLLAHVPTCHKRDNHSTWRANVPKGVPIFQLFFRRIFQFTNFSIMPDICKFQEYLGNSRKFTLRKKGFKFEYSQNFIKEKSCQPRIFDVAFNRTRGINRRIIRLV